MHNILILEDDRGLNNGITMALKNENYQFVQAFDIATARENLKTDNFDLILMDVNLPDGNGFDLLREIRHKDSVPIIMLTANDTELDVVTGLESGADDYITKPFSLMILRARVNAQLRRQSETVSKEIQVDDFYFNFENMEFKRDDKPVELSKTEQKLLRLLVENRGNTLSRAELVDRIWTDGAEYVDENALSVTIKRLRSKLNAPEYIKTVYGVGYTWVVK